MLIWQQPLAIATTGGGSIPVQANAKYISGTVATTGNASTTRDISGMITYWMTNGTTGGTINAPYNFNKGPVIAMTGTWRWAGIQQEIYISAGGKTMRLVRSANSSATLDGVATGLVGDTSGDIRFKFVVDLNAGTASVYQYTTAWTLRKTNQVVFDTTVLTGSIYVTGRDSASQSNSSMIYSAGVYNNIDLLAS